MHFLSNEILKLINFLIFSDTAKDFLVIKPSNFDIILKTDHKASLLAYLLAAVNVTQQVWLQLKRSDE